MNKQIIIGITGNPGSGKSTIAQYLATQHGFVHFEGSDYLRKVAKERGITLASRSDYSNLHRALQKEFGPTVMAEYFLAKPESRLIFSGLRSTQNAQKLKDAGGIIIALHTPAKVRFMRKNKNEFNDAAFTEFEKIEQEQLVSTDHLGADLQATMDMADIVVDTEKELQQIFAEVDELIKKSLR